MLQVIGNYSGWVVARGVDIVSRFISMREDQPSLSREKLKEHFTSIFVSTENVVVSNIDLSCPGFSHSGDSSGHTQQPHIEPQCMPQGWQSTIVYKDTTRLGLLIQPNTSLRYDKLAFRSRTTLEFGSHCRMTLTRIEFNASGLCGVELVRIERERLGSRRGATKNYTMESWTTCDGRKLQLVSGHFSNPKNDEILYTPSENRMVELSFNMIPPRHGSCPKCRISSGIDKGEVLPDLHLYAVGEFYCAAILTSKLARFVFAASCLFGPYPQSVEPKELILMLVKNTFHLLRCLKY